MQDRVRLYWFAFMFVIFEFTTYAANDMIMPGMLSVVQEFHASLANVAGSVAIYALGSSLIQIFLGPLAENYGKRRLILIGNMLFLGFTLLLAMAQSITEFMWARFFQGSCMGFIALGYAIINNSSNDKDALKITALMANVSVLAPLLGPIIGGGITSYFSWRYVFIFSGITGFISLLGLIKFTPREKVIKRSLKLDSVLRDYFIIIKIPGFLLGLFALTFAILPFLLWIAFSPTIIMRTAKMDLNHYLVMQVIAVSGFMLSSALMQIIAGRLKLVKLTYIGLSVVMLGLTFAFICHSNLWLFSSGICIYNLGLGLVNGSILRTIGTLAVANRSMLFSLLVSLETFMMAASIYVVDIVLGKFGYSLFCYGLMCFMFGVIASILVLRFAYLNRNRTAQ